MYGPLVNTPFYSIWDVSLRWLQTFSNGPFTTETLKFEPKRKTSRFLFQCKNKKI